MTENQIMLTIEYHGHFRLKTQRSYEKLKVSADFEKGIGQIKCHLKSQYNIEGGFMTFINNESIVGLMKTNSKTTLSENGVIKIIPIASGG